MGLAAYGQPEYLEEFRRIVRTQWLDGFRWDWNISRIIAPGRK